MPPLPVWGGAEGSADVERGKGGEGGRRWAQVTSCAGRTCLGWRRLVRRRWEERVATQKSGRNTLVGWLRRGRGGDRRAGAAGRTMSAEGMGDG